MKKLFISVFVLLSIQTSKSTLVSRHMLNNDICYSSGQCPLDSECINNECVDTQNNEIRQEDSVDSTLSQGDDSFEENSDAIIHSSNLDDESSLDNSFQETLDEDSDQESQDSMNSEEYSQQN